ncbi:unnamed protein product [Oppiella nova]|uniref:Carboxylic ester hydrolase n=1 Tax=Oppiella nova TaxID=334625 RepID=A0A7R9MIC2_9ACAR|nr:unnamed protein product [Oppiella nova]CAG2176929.1 unnamed protein product [Oppiella nova]
MLSPRLGDSGSVDHDPFKHRNRVSSMAHEDCLTLIVWTPSEHPLDKPTGALKPVMFSIHGGAFSIGSIYSSVFNASVLSTYGTVVVSVGYRLGRLGFLYGGDDSAPGNVGLYDQQLALKWVRDNIHAFGGDRDQMTVFGESAGSWSISAHILSPLSRGLFKRAIMQSGALMFNKHRSLVTTAEALSKAKQFARQLNCSDPHKWLDCLRDIKDPNLFSESYDTSNTYGASNAVFGTQFLPLLPQKAFETHAYSSGEYQGNSFEMNILTLL